MNLLSLLPPFASTISDRDILGAAKLHSTVMLRVPYNYSLLQYNYTRGTRKSYQFYIITDR